MIVEPGYGDLLAAPVDALVNAVNTVGVMGKGLALQFKQAFPDDFAAYQRACNAGEVTVGRMFLFRRPNPPKLIINFPTKKHWRDPSRIEYLRDGLVDLAQQIRQHHIESIALPPLGCGLGGLDWAVVKPMILETLASIPTGRALLFEPRWL